VNLRMRVSWLIMVFGLLVMAGCAPAQLMPQFDQAVLEAKRNEIANQAPRLPHDIEDDPSLVLSRIYDRLEPHARAACIENGEKWLESSCSSWSLNVVDDDNFNAYITPSGEITFHSEVFKYTQSDDEVAFILAHEMSHHILNHAMEDIVNGEIMGATTGLLSGILVGAIAAGLGASEDAVSDIVESAVEDGYATGRESGRLTYSIDQESEADKLGLQLFKLAGYDQSAARQVMLFIGASSTELRSQQNATHPTGPERLAAFDLYAADKRLMLGCVEGDCVDGVGTYEWSDGRRYEGQWKNDNVHGQGAFSYANGNKFVGQFKAGKISGQGRFESVSGHRYVGEYKNNQRHGWGTYTWPDGSKYEGQFAEDEQNGHGSYSFPDGRVVEGIWENGKLLEQ
jgi:hypothetical protein